MGYSSLRKKSGVGKMIYSIDQPSILDSMGRLAPRDMTIEEARIIEGVDGIPYIFLDDYISLIEAGKESQIYSRYHINLEDLHYIVDEARIINNPHYLKSRGKYINKSKLSIRPLNTRHTTKIAEEALAFFEEYDDPTLFDQFINEEENAEIHFVKNAAIKGATSGLRDGIKQQAAKVKSDIKNDLKKTAKRGALLVGTLYAGKKIADHIADQDARKPNYLRSDLIKKLRVLRGKLPEYESKYERAEREHWENKGIIGKISWKIKAAIKKITDKLKGMAHRFSKT